MLKKYTSRGFKYYEFHDNYKALCTIQQSSSVEPKIWLGIDNANPQVMASKTPEGGTGWVKYHIPDDVLLTTRMHLTQRDVLRLLPKLIQFIITGRI